MFEFVNDAPAKALTWHTAPYTGSVDCIVPKGTRAWLGARMNPAYHYFNPVEGSYTSAWMESIVSKAREESPIPQRFNGGLSFFISIKALLEDQVKFLPSNQANEADVNDVNMVLPILREEYAQAKQCALHEESESFKRMVKAGWCSPQLSDDDRNSLLSED